MLRPILVFSILIAIGINVWADTSSLPRAVLLPSYSASVIDDAMATTINPAGLGVRRGTNAYYLHTFSGKTGGDNAFFISSSGFGFGAEFTNPGWVKFTKYTLSDGMRLLNNLYIGSSYARFRSKSDVYNGLPAWDMGLLYRPSDLLSIGLVARNLNRPVFEDSHIDRAYNLSFAFRPYTNRLTFSLDTVFQAGKSVRDAKMAYAIECEPIKGVIFRGSYNNDGDFDMRFGVGFPQLEVGAYSCFDQDWNRGGGVAYARFSGEQRRTILRGGRYVLEMEASELARSEIQDSFLLRAKKDNTIDGIMLRLDGDGYSISKMQEMQDVLLDFRSSGKKVVCYIEQAGNKGYYLASACDSILLNPAGSLSLNGLRAEITFYRGVLDKLGIEADLYKVGKYKSASEPYTREDISHDFRESMNSLLDDLSDQMVSGIAEGRGISSDEVQDRIDKGPYTAKEALKAGLVDSLVYEDQLEAVMRQTFGKNAAKLPGEQYRNRKNYRYDWREEPKIAVIYATGMIATGRSMFSEEWMESSLLFPFPQIMGSETITEAVRKAREDSSIKAIVLRIDSGGGLVFASDIIWREVMLAKKQKPLIVSMSDMAASGGYYIACPAEVIVAEPGTVTGSIGVIAGKPNLRGIYDKLGIKKEILKRGRNSDIYTTYAGFTDEQKEIIKRQIKEMYDDFISKVAQGRNMTEDAVEAVAQGRVWTGRQAKDNGLVDEMGGLQMAISIAKSKAGLRDDRVDIVALPERAPFWYRLFYGDRLFLTGVSGSAPVSKVIEVVERFADERMFLLIPYKIDCE